MRKKSKPWRDNLGETNMKSPIEYSNALRRNCALAVFVFASLSQGARAEVVDAKATQLLTQMAQAERGANYSAVQTIERADATSVQVRIWRLGRQRRLEYLAPALNRGDVLLDDGENTWLYHRAENAAIQTRSQKMRDGNLRDGNSRKTARPKIIGQTQMNGRAAWIVDVSRNGTLARRLWIDKAAKLRLSVQFFGTNKKSMGRTTLENLKIGNVGAAQFRWQPPGGAQIVRTSGTLFSQFAPAKQSAIWLRYPRFLPAGYHFESAIVDSSKGEAWLRYANATRRFSIFQQRAQASLQADKAPQRVDDGWYRTQNGSRQLIVGAPENLAKRVLESVQ